MGGKNPGAFRPQDFAQPFFFSRFSFASRTTDYVKEGLLVVYTLNGKGQNKKVHKKKSTGTIIWCSWFRRIIRFCLLWQKSKRLLAQVVRKVDNTIHRINHYSVDSVVCFVNTYPLDSVIKPLNNWGQFLKAVYSAKQTKYSCRPSVNQYFTQFTLKRSKDLSKT